MAVLYLASIIPVVCILTLTPLLCAEKTRSRKIVVSETEGIDRNECWSGAGPASPCRTLDYALEHVTNSTLVQLRPGKSPFNLSRHFNFTNLFEFELVGDQESIASIQCLGNQGSLSFENSRNITLRRILLRGCGGLHASTTGSEFKNYAHIPFLSAVFLVYCKDVVIDNCWIVQSPGIGLNMYDTGGDVQISHSRFESNQPINATDKDRAIAGGGVYLEFTYHGGTCPFDVNSTVLDKYDTNSTFNFFNCTFRNNSAPNQQYETIVKNPSGDDHIPFGRGGGLSIFFKGKAENNVIYVTGCHFEDNYALWGGGIFIEFHDQVQNNTFEVKNCTFRDNSARFAGGGVRSGVTAHSDKQLLIPNRMKYEDCRFESNQAIWGGGVSYYQTSSSKSSLVDDMDKLHIVYEKCHWRNNRATSGSAVGLATGPAVNGLQEFFPRRLLLYVIVLEDCNLYNNSIMLLEDEDVIGQGAIYSFSLPIIFKGVVNIDYSNNTAMVIENAVLHFFGNVTFRNNTGSQGGAIGLYGTSTLMLMPQSNLNFFNNTAQDRGGAIYVRDSGPPVIGFKTTQLKTRQCFLAYNNDFSLDNITNWQTKLIFKGNQVLTKGGGESVFASTLQGCRQSGQPRINNESLEWHNVIQYQDLSKTTKEQISTYPIFIKFTEEEWMVSPGEVFDATIKLIDEKNSPGLGIVKVTITDEHEQNKAGSVNLGTASHLFLVQGDSSKINNLTLHGNVDRSFKVDFVTVVGRVTHNSSKGKLTLQPCNVGFEQTDGKTCSCISSNSQPGISNCSADFKHVFLKRGYWGGTVEDKFSTYPCPTDYCSNFSIHGSVFQYDAEKMCTAGRNGTSVLCGACKDGYSVNLGNERCRKSCSNSHLWITVAFCLVTPLLVLLVLWFDLDIFTTYLNTWLYSYQIILFLLGEGQSLDPFISFVIGVANWELRVGGTCLYKGMTNLQKLGVNYIFPSYILLLLVVLAKIARRRPGCYINRNVSHAFCTLLVLCYTNVTIISFKIVHYVHMQERWVLYADGNIDFVKDWKRHLPFTIIACLWIVLFVLFVPLLLLFTPWFLRRFPYLNNFRLYFDTFQRCFKVTYRWFAAYYFICRIYILIIALYVPFSPLKRCILDVSSILIVVTCLYLQPYNEQYQWFNRLDAVLLTNLCLIVNFSSSIVSDVTLSVRDGLENTVNLLAYVPLAYLIGLVLYNGWKYCCPKNFREGYFTAEQRTRSDSMTETAAHASPI